MAPDTQQNLIYTIYFIILHNSLPILYSIGIIVSLLLAFFKPTRSAILMMLGFIILLFAFEYSKHIIEPLKEQTKNSLITVRQSYRIERTIHIVIARLIPLGLPILGWLMVLIGSWLGIPQYLRHFKEFFHKTTS